jgi:hypothetical protein
MGRLSEMETGKNIYSDLQVTAPADVRLVDFLWKAVLLDVLHETKEVEVEESGAPVLQELDLARGVVEEWEEHRLAKHLRPMPRLRRQLTKGNLLHDRRPTIIRSPRSLCTTHGEDHILSPDGVLLRSWEKLATHSRKSIFVRKFRGNQYRPKHYRGNFLTKDCLGACGVYLGPRRYIDASSAQ